MNKRDYLRESLQSSFEDHGIVANEEQIQNVADDISLSFENMSLAFPIPENPMINEVSKLKKELEYERKLVHCEECNGRGRIQEWGPYHGSNSECHVCRGKGKHLPK